MQSTRRELSTSKVEYKLVKLPVKGIFTKDVSEDLENVLNSEGNDGWRWVNTVLPAGGLGESEKVALIFMRDARQCHSVMQLGMPFGTFTYFLTEPFPSSPAHSACPLASLRALAGSALKAIFGRNKVLHAILFMRYG